MAEPITAFDLGRMFLGDEPPLFYAEIAFRTVLIYLYTLVLIRWIGSRSIAQLSLVEFLLVIALGSAVGDAMFYPDVPLIHCMAVITIVVLLDKALSSVLAQSPLLEDVIEGKSVEVVRGGRINFAALSSLNFGHDELFEQLRLKDVEHLGQVRAAYLETTGQVSMFREDRDLDRPGLSIEPPWDVSEPQSFRAGQKTQGPALYACIQCAMVRNQPAQTALPACPECGGDTWHLAQRNERAETSR